MRMIVVVILVLGVFSAMFSSPTMAWNDYCNLQVERLDEHVNLVQTDASQDGLDRMELGKEDLPDLVRAIFYRINGFELNREITILMSYPQDFKYFVDGVQSNYGGVGGQHFVYDTYYCRYFYRPGSAQGQNMAFITVGFNWELQHEDSLIFGNLVHEISHAAGTPDNHTGWMLWNANTWHMSDTEYQHEIAEHAYYNSCDLYAKELYEAAGNYSRRFYRDVLPTFNDVRYLACLDLQEIRNREE